MLMPQAFAADPGHLASSIAAGMFEIRRKAYHPVGQEKSDAE